MKNIVFLYAGFGQTHAFDMLFPKNFSTVPAEGGAGREKSAFALSLEWAGGIRDREKIVIAASRQTEDRVKREILKADLEDVCAVVVEPRWNTQLLLKRMAESASRYGASYVVYSAADRPFLDRGLTEHVISDHLKYLSEYTFADGYPAGLSPEVVDSGSLNILQSLASRKESFSSDRITKESLFNVLREDINSFEIETVIAPKDFRMLRLDFSCSSRASTISCVHLFRAALECGCPFDALSLAELASSSPDVQRTVPAFYNVQIAANLSTLAVYNPYPEEFRKKTGCLPVKKENPTPEDMPLDKFTSLVDGIAALSETAVVGLSGFSEPLTQPAFMECAKAVLAKPGLSLLIETDGTLLTAPIAQKLSDIVKDSPERTGEWPAVIWIVSIDAFTDETYCRLHTNAFTNANGIRSFDSAKAALLTLEQYFPGDVYPQFVRMKDNEDELEKFYRFYHDPESACKGRLVIQKYDSFCGLLPDLKSADLAPLERYPCWHCKRDMTVLPDGSVPVCREYVLDASCGNVFDDGVETVWKRMGELMESHVKGQYPDRCVNCDEYYTFNF
ncbi:MAG: spiro-SPASM protein [Treponema sp.]|nr:spiro-SPASM protein [Treponema sp.]